MVAGSIIVGLFLNFPLGRRHRGRVGALSCCAGTIDQRGRCGRRPDHALCCLDTRSARTHAAKVNAVGLDERLARERIFEPSRTQHAGTKLMLVFPVLFAVALIPVAAEQEVATCSGADKPGVPGRRHKSREGAQAVRRCFQRSADSHSLEWTFRAPAQSGGPC